MTARKTAELLDRDESLRFYEDRYERGYMDQWPSEKESIITEVMQSLELPGYGSALDTETHAF